MNGTLLCGVEETDQGRRAVEFAVRISERLELRLVLANVVAVPGRLDVDPEDEVFWRHRQGASVMLRQVARDHDLADGVERRVVVGDVAGSLARIAAEEAADLVVIGGRRRGALGRRRSGRLAAQLEWETQVPVLVAMCPEHIRGRSRKAVGDPS